MSDLIERLRDGLVSAETSCEAADRITELEAENTNLKNNIKKSGRMKALQRVTELEADVKFWNEAFLEQRASAEKEVARLTAAITKTLNENGHLADGENCTLIELKRAMGVSHE